MIPRFNVSFSDLLTLTLEKGATHYITRLPKVLLTDFEKQVQAFLHTCADSGFCPTEAQVKENFNVLLKPQNLPIDVVYHNFTTQARERYLAEKQIEFMEDNKRQGKGETEGLIDFINETISKTAIPSPEIISYKEFDRTIYQADILSLQWHIPFFDELTNGLVGGDFVVILAATKTGKTTLIKLAAQAAFEHNEAVMFCSQEQAVVRMAQQFDMQRLGKIHSSLRHGVDEKTQHELAELQKALRKKKRDSNIYITPQVKSVAQLHEYISSCEVKPTKIFIDGLNLMQGNHSDNSYSSLAQVSADLKEYANKHNICIIAVTQTNRSGAKAGEMVDATAIAGSFAIAMFADVMIAMTPKPETIGSQKLPHVWIRTILHRHGEAGGVNIRMTPHYDKERDKFTVEFAELESDWSPETTNITYAAKKAFIAQLEATTGINWGELSEDQQSAMLATVADSNIKEDY